MTSQQDTQIKKAKLSVFLKWDLRDVFGYTTVVEDKIEYVDLVWCKVCAAHSRVAKPTEVRGATESSTESFTVGLKRITKHTVERHHNGKLHKNALQEEKKSSSLDRVVQDKALPIGPTQKTILSLTEKSSQGAYLRLIITAYEMALNPTMSLNHFKVMVDVQRKNGVKFIEGKHDGRSAKKFLTTIHSAVAEKCRSIIDSRNFFGVLTDGSQARKTGDDKEMVLVKVAYKGSPICMFGNLLQMSRFGGTDAVSLKKGIDSIFLESGSLPCLSYREKLVCCTSDGASVNTGATGGLMAKMTREDDRPWLVAVHCVNHRVELAVKDALNNSSFKTVERLYQTLYYLCKNSGVLKTDIKKAAEALGISCYTFPKLSGTRFIPHHRRAISRLLDMWPAVISALDNTLVIRKHKPETKGKIIGLVKQFRSYSMLCACCSYLDLLDKMSPMSKIFEENQLLPFDVRPIVSTTVMELEEIVEVAGTEEELLDSYLNRFPLTDVDEDVPTLKSKFVKFGHMLRKAANREYIELEFENFTYLNNASVVSATTEKKRVAEELIKTIQDRFSSFDNKLFHFMLWMDPRNWEDEKGYGVDMLEAFYNHFQVPLDHAGFDVDKIKKEWKHFRNFVKGQFGVQITTAKTDANKIWAYILQFKQKEFPNLVLMAEIVFCISGSNSAVERSFSILTLLLTDRRLKLDHDTIVMFMNIKTNDSLWSDSEREDLKKRAVEIYMEKRRKKRVDKSVESTPKRARVEEISSSEEEDSEDSENSEDDE